MFFNCFSRSTHIFKVFLIAALLLPLMFSPCPAADKFIVIAYHDITQKRIVEDDFTPDEFMKQLNFFKANGYHPVSIQDIEDAAAGKKSLPDKALLLTFDDGYLSFYRIVYPALKLFGYPAVLSVVTSWADGRDNPGPFYKSKQFMTWEQIREVARSGLVTVAPHSDNLHKLVQANPQGNIEPAMTTFIFDQKTGAYESEERYRERIRADIARTVSIFQEKAGIKPTVFTWPYSAYNEIAIEEAKKQGFQMLLTLEEGLADTQHLDRINRYYAQNMLFWVPTFKEELKQGLVDTTPIRGVQIDLDKIVDPASYEKSDRNLGKCLDRLESLGVNTVIVQAFCDNEGSGNVKSLYYYNTVLPVEMDFLAHAVNRIKARGMQAFVWMPSLSFVLPDSRANEELQVRELKNGQVRIAASSYKRLSPFDKRSLAVSQAIFRDLSAYVDFDGVLFQDDAYLTDEEDFHPAAAATFKAAFGRELSASSMSDNSLKIKWRGLKTETIDRFIAELVKTVRTYRPSARIARNIYSEVVSNPKSQDWFSQNLESYLQRYDYTVIMAYSRMEKIGSRARVKKWMKDLFDRVKKYNGTDKVIFKVQAFDWENNRWIDEATIKEELTSFLALGARHIAYYPDGVVEDKPRRDDIASIVSGREYARDIKKKGQK